MMRPPNRALIGKPSIPLFFRTSELVPTIQHVFQFCPYSVVRIQASMSTSPIHYTSSSSHSVSPKAASNVRSEGFGGFLGKLQVTEESIEKYIYRCRFLAILPVCGSLIGSFLCFFRGCMFVAASFHEYFVNRGKVIGLLIESLDVYLLGTVMLVFGMGLYELFISNLDIAKSISNDRVPQRSNLFGLFTLTERPRWLDISSVDELKTKVGHVIVMLLLIGLFDKIKKAAIISPADLLCFASSVFLSSGCLYLLSKLHGSK